MSDDEKRYLRIDSPALAQEFNIDVNHLLEHIAVGITCTLNGNTSWLDEGFYVQMRDTHGRTWTLSVLPEDGGVISGALLDEAARGTS